LKAEIPAQATRPPLIVVVGNPNAGKTTLFNRLTGLNQRIGNYPGVTVEKVTGKVVLGDTIADCVDVPGLYSLKAISVDETVAMGVLRGRTGERRRPDLLVCVMDAGNLERNLFLFSQLADAEFPMVVALTMTDLLEGSGRQVDTAKLRALLGVPVVRVVAHKGVGIAQLKQAMADALSNGAPATKAFRLPQVLEAQVTQFHERLARYGFDVPVHDVRQALMGFDPELLEQLRPYEELYGDLEHVSEQLQGQGFTREKLDLRRRYDWAARVARQVLPPEGALRVRRITDRIDRVVTHRVFGLLIFVGLMYLMFQSIYTFAQPLMGGIEAAVGWLGQWVGGWLGTMPVFQSLMVDGLITGVGTVLTFLPQIMILFFFIAVLEGTGYLARAAFLMDRCFGWCGLNGRAFVPLLSSFACAIPGIMAARVMPDPKSRLATILIAPLMSCSARLPVYILLIGAFVEPSYGPVWAGIALFGMHAVGAIVAIPVVWVLTRKVLRGKRLPFVLELPPYQWPKWRDVWLTMYFRGKVFVQTAGTIIVAMSVIVWALTYFPRSPEASARYAAEYQAQSEEVRSRIQPEHFVQEREIADSYLGRFGRFIEPVFAPAGFDWRLSMGILAAFPAREVVVPALGIIFNLGADVSEESPDLRKALQAATRPDGQPLITPWVAAGYMVFFALCCQCMSTLATVKRETQTWRWPLFMFVYMTALAYLAAVAIYQVGRWVS
jgi:ferrous iron transport protein B